MAVPHADQTLDSPPTAIAEVRARLGTHTLYEAIRTDEALRILVEHYVVCVLDFISFLESLQRDLTCVAVPWVPTADSEAEGLIHRIVLDKETDVRGDGRAPSHLARYLEPMKEVRADFGPARGLVEVLAGGTPLRVALRTSALPACCHAVRRDGGRTVGTRGHRANRKVGIERARGTSYAAAPNYAKP